MSKQKIVIKVAMTCDKCRSKALALVAATGGVDSVALGGDEKDQVVVVGEDVDSVKLTRLLRKKVGHAHIVQVADAKKAKEEEEEKKKKKKEEEEAAAAAAAAWHYYNSYPPPPVYHHQYPAAAYGYHCDSGHSDTCSIM